jgi:hypothetical protein
MLKNLSFVALIAALSTLALPGLTHAQTVPNLAGTYRCVPEPSSCQWQEPMPTISQSGSTLQLNINKDEFAEAKLTSNITVSAGPPFIARTDQARSLIPHGDCRSCSIVSLFFLKISLFPAEKQGDGSKRPLYLISTPAT